MLTTEEKHRYSRQIALDGIGELGQQKLKQAKVLVIGAGGLGCPVLTYLVGAGVGTIGVIDFDIVEESNLHRQVLYTTSDIGKNKAEATEAHLLALNPYVRIVSYAKKLNSSNALDFIEEYDLVVDGSDNFETRYLVNDACVKLEKPFVYGAIYKFEGQVSVFNYQNGPTYRCLFPDLPETDSVPNCGEVGVLGVLPAIIGGAQANETLKIILEIGDVASGKLILFNILSAEQEIVTIHRQEEQIKIAREIDLDNFDYSINCSSSLNHVQDEISAEELKQLLLHEDVQVIDVREPHEQPKVDALAAVNIPLQVIPYQLDKIKKDKKVVIYCQHGVRSLHAIGYLKEKGYNNLINLTGGIVNWN